jgi:predicted nucleotidyltransferase
MHSEGPATDEARQDAELTKIRDLLFGAQLRDAERKRSDLEVRLSGSIAQLRTDALQRLEALAQELKQQVAALEKTIQQEARARAEQLEALNKRIVDTNQIVAELAEKSEAAQHALHERVNSESERIYGELRNQQQATYAQIQDLGNELRSAKADRNLLAELLSGMSSRLLNDKPRPT